MGRRLAAGVMAMAMAGSVQAGALGDLLRDTLNHPALDAGAKQVSAANKDVDAATAAYLGGGAAGVEDATYESDRFLGVLNPQAFANPPFARTQLRYGASYSLPVDVFGVIASNRAAAKQNLAVAELSLRQQTLGKLHQTLAAWLQLQVVAREGEALASERARVKLTSARVEEQVRVGQLGPTDLKLVQSELAHVEAGAAQLDGERARALASLEESTGQAVAPPTQEMMKVPAWPQAGAADQALPVRIASAQAEAAADQARAQRRSLWPALSAGADYYQFEGSGRSQEAWMLGGRVTMPLDFGNVMRDHSAEDRARAARDAELAAQRQSREQWQSLQAAYNAALANLNALQREVDAREQVVAVQKELAGVGAVSVEDSLRRERDLYEARAGMAQARAQAVMAWSAAQVLAGIDPDTYIEGLDKQ